MPVEAIFSHYQRDPLQHGNAVIFQLCDFIRVVGEEFDVRNVEGFEMLASIDVSIKQAMEELGASLKKYLLEAGERFEEKELSKKEPPKEKPDRKSVV